jgi:hypothetical protein
MTEPWRSFLNELDRIATTTVRLDCIGGFVVTMLYGLSRPTADVDVLEIAPRDAADAFSQVAMLGGPLFHKYGVYLDRNSNREMKSRAFRSMLRSMWLSLSSSPNISEIGTTPVTRRSSAT